VGFHCWKCGKHSLVEYVRLRLGRTEQEARAIIKGYGGKAGRATTGGKRAGIQVPFPSLMADVLDDPTVGKPVIRYLNKRGIDGGGAILKHDVRWGGVSGEWHHRLIIPLRDYEGLFCGWVGRAIGPMEPRYKVAKEGERARDILFNHEHSTGKSVVVVEGLLDAISMGDGTIATQGIAYTRRQVLECAKRYARVIVAFDNEPAAQRQGAKFAHELRMLGVEAAQVNLWEELKIKDATDVWERYD